MIWDIVNSAWRAVVEILILAVGIYYVFRFVRGTRGAPVMTGFLVLLLALVLVSYLLNLKVLRYFLGGFSAFFALGVLVIFQPELRRLLAELGKLPLFATAHEQRSCYPNRRAPGGGPHRCAYRRRAIDQPARGRRVRHPG